MEDNEPESQSLSLQVWETAQRARELSASFKKGSLGPGGQQAGEVLSPAGQSLRQLMPREISVEQHSGVWSLAVSTVVWNLPQLYP